MAVFVSDAAGLVVPVAAAAVLDVPVEGLEELEEPEELEELDAGAIGWKESLLAPKPIFDAKVPPTETDTFLFVPATTIFPLPSK